MNTTLKNTAIDEITGRVFDIQGFSVHDGPGIRTTVFLKGCPLRCRWCHSPESQRFETEIDYLKSKCIGCGRCVSACPTGARTFSVDEKDPEQMHYATDSEKCTSCGLCVKACLPHALYYCGKDSTVDEVMERVIRDKPYFDTSNGGITVSGGECLCQSVFVAALLERCKFEGIHTAVDTCGFVPYDNIREVLPHTDLFLYDLKHMDSDAHRKGTGVPNELILENARAIASDGGKFHIRLPLIPGFNDSASNILSMIEFLQALGDSVELIQILPYHDLGTVKWERLLRPAPDFYANPPTDEEVDGVCALFEGAGFKTIVH